MKFDTPLIPGKLIKRYKRFLADVELTDGSIVTAHTTNTGSMLGLIEANSHVWLSESDNPKRKLKYTWEIGAAGKAPVGVNTAIPNKLVFEEISSGNIPLLTGYTTIKREVKYGQNSRIDVFLQAKGKADCYVEIKSVTLSREPGIAEFPDAVSARGTKHLQELGDMIEEGHRAVMFYLAQRSDCTRFVPAKDIDPVYADALKVAITRGVEVIAYGCNVTPEGIHLDKPLELGI
ncbi:sugar fermentation stimulation protein [Kiloniella litopenaei]|uniref:Sugar fermentation stimulation protein homolog n=1 Tax=Kiloniella litopenaei TaxID=1549748 RepID=A0A0M2R7N3_9PROT|nr:DNA/RNA nuclease SfsA [Kiloniella litopenaei]KKJ76424.1 sugar fermentation stimulation protein [Kiloniella litopenaei]